MADLATLARRAASNPTINPRNRGTIATDLATRVAFSGSAYSPGRNRKAVRMTKAQRNSLGRRSEWSASPYYSNAVTRDSRYGMAAGAWVR